MKDAVLRAAAVKSLTALAQRLKENDLDGVVCELALSEAKAVNEKGIEAQIAFIVDEMGPEKAEEFIRSRHEEWNTLTDPEGAACVATS